MPKTLLTALACLLTLALAVPADAALARTEQQPYFGNNDVLRLTEFDNVCKGGPHAVHYPDEVGGVCFRPGTGVVWRHVAIRIEDRSGLPVGGFYSFTTKHTASHPAQYVSAHFCGHTGAYVPDDLDVLSVVIDGAIQGPYDCAPIGNGPGIGTSGSVYVTWTS